MTKDQFYREKQIVRVVWWIEPSFLPARQVRARQRIFSDGTADSTFGESELAYGFDSADYAGYIISEDEFERLDGWDETDASEHGVALPDLVPPSWNEA